MQIICKSELINVYVHLINNLPLFSCLQTHLHATSEYIKETFLRRRQETLNHALLKQSN